MIYTKGDQEVHTNDKFVYCISVYRIWKKGASLLNETYYRCNRALNLKKIPMKRKKKGYIIQRYVELVAAPEDYLISNHYKELK